MENLAHLKTGGVCRIVNKHEQWDMCADTFQGCRKTNDVPGEDADTAGICDILNDSNLNRDSCLFAFICKMWNILSGG